jgi:hypothetical protein
LLFWESVGSGSGYFAGSRYFAGSGSGSSIGSRLTQHVYKQQKICPKTCLFNARSWPLIFYLLTFVLHFMLDPGPNPVTESEPDTEPECMTVPVPQRQKVAVPWVPVPVPQH